MDSLYDYRPDSHSAGKPDEIIESVQYEMNVQ